MLRPEVLKGHLDMLLLAVLEPGPLHGYAIIDAVRRQSNGTVDLPTGTAYPALHRLERAGLVSSAWRTVDGRRRREYQLTAVGAATLVDQRAAWHRFSGAVNAVIGGVAWQAAT